MEHYLFSKREKWDRVFLKVRQRATHFNFFSLPRQRLLSRPRRRLRCYDMSNGNNAPLAFPDTLSPWEFQCDKWGQFSNSFPCLTNPLQRDKTMIRRWVCVTRMLLVIHISFPAVCPFSRVPSLCHPCVVELTFDYIYINVCLFHLHIFPAYFLPNNFRNMIK